MRPLIGSLLVLTTPAAVADPLPAPAARIVVTGDEQYGDDAVSDATTGDTVWLAVDPVAQEYVAFTVQVLGTAGPIVEVVDAQLVLDGRVEPLGMSVNNRFQLHEWTEDRPIGRVIGFRLFPPEPGLDWCRLQDADVQISMTLRDEASGVELPVFHEGRATLTPFLAELCAEG